MGIGYFLCGEKHLTLLSDWKNVQLIDSIAQQTTKQFSAIELNVKKVRGGSS